MLTAIENRKINLKELLERSGLAQNQLSQRIDMSPSYLSQILGPKAARNIGDKLARRIETKLGMPKGWMDQEHAQLAIDHALNLFGINLEFQIKAAKFIQQLSPRELEHLEALIKLAQPQGDAKPKN